MVYHGLSHYVPCFIITIHSLAMGIAVKKKWFYWLSMWLYVYELLPEYNYYRHDDYRHEHEQLRISQSKWMMCGWCDLYHDSTTKNENMWPTNMWGLHNLKLWLYKIALWHQCGDCTHRLAGIVIRCWLCIQSFWLYGYGSSQSWLSYIDLPKKNLGNLPRLVAIELHGIWRQKQKPWDLESHSFGENRLDLARIRPILTIQGEQLLVLN